MSLLLPTSKKIDINSSIKNSSAPIDSNQMIEIRSNNNTNSNSNNKEPCPIKQSCEFVLDDNDLEDNEDINKVIEESQNGRWSKLDSEISASQKLIDFDSTYLGVDNEKGSEVAWNEMKYYKSASKSYLNRFSSAKALESITEKLAVILKFLIELDNTNILKFFDFWFVNNDFEAKLVVITEYSMAGSLKKVLDSSKINRTKVKSSTYKRWLNQILYSCRYLHNQGISLFQGNLNTDTIFIQNCGVIKLTPTLLSLYGICEAATSSIRFAAFEKPQSMGLECIKLTKKLMIKDIHAIGRLALEIFTAHLKNRTPLSPTLKHARSANQTSFDLLTSLVNLDECDFLSQNACYIHELNEDLQKDFVLKCLNADENTHIESVWFHPLVNEIYSLKILSVFSILTYFQEKKKSKLAHKSYSRSGPNARNSIPKIIVEDNNNINNQSWVIIFSNAN